MSLSKKNIDKIISSIDSAKTMKEKRNLVDQLNSIKSELISIIDFDYTNENNLEVNIDNVDSIIDQLSKNLSSIKTSTIDIELKKNIITIKNNIESCLNFLNSSKAQFFCEDNGEISDITDKIKKQFTINKVITS